MKTLHVTKTNQLVDIFTKSLKGLLLRALTFILWVLVFLYNSFTEIWGVKEAVLVGFKFGLVPVVLGGSLMDHCTLPMFGIGMTISRKLEFLAAYPFTMVLYWICGFLFLTMASHSIQNVMVFFFCFIRKRPYILIMRVKHLIFFSILLTQITSSLLSTRPQSYQLQEHETAYSPAFLFDCFPWGCDGA